MSEHTAIVQWQRQSAQSTEQSLTDQSVTDQSVTDQSVTEQSVIDQSVTDRQFIENHYSREHIWQFDSGITIAASASPHVVPVPYSNPDCVDPEEAFIAALASCHMLWFLSIAAKRKFAVASYVDRAIGKIEKNAAGRMAMTQVRLRPTIVFTGDRQPIAEQIKSMHETAHHQCFLANSVRTEIIVELEYDINGIQ